MQTYTQTQYFSLYRHAESVKDPRIPSRSRRQHLSVSLKQRHMGLIRPLRAVLIQMEALQTVMLPSRLGQPSVPQTHTPHLLKVTRRGKTGRHKKQTKNHLNGRVMFRCIFFSPFRKTLVSRDCC